MYLIEEYYFFFSAEKPALILTHLHSSAKHLSMPTWALRPDYPIPPCHVLTCSMVSACHKSLELLMRVSNMRFCRIFPRSTWAPVLTVFNTHLVLNSRWKLLKREGTRVWTIRGDGKSRLDRVLLYHRKSTVENKGPKCRHNLLEQTRV